MNNKNNIVLDVLQTKSEDLKRENEELKQEIERLKKEIESESVLFNMKVVELQDKFYQVEEQIRMKNQEIERLRGNTSDCGQSVATETEILEDTLRSGINANAITNDSGIYTSLDLKFPVAPVPMSSQVIRCLRQFLIIIIIITIIITITIVIPLKIAFSS